MAAARTTWKRLAAILAAGLDDKTCADHVEPATQPPCGYIGPRCLDCATGPGKTSWPPSPAVSNTSRNAAPTARQTQTQRTALSAATRPTGGSTSTFVSDGASSHYGATPISWRMGRCPSRFTTYGTTPSDLYRTPSGSPELSAADATRRSRLASTSWQRGGRQPGEAAPTAPVRPGLHQARWPPTATSPADTA